MWVHCICAQQTHTQASTNTPILETHFNHTGWQCDIPPPHHRFHLFIRSDLLNSICFLLCLVYRAFDVCAAYALPQQPTYYVWQQHNRNHLIFFVELCFLFLFDGECQFLCEHMQNIVVVFLRVCAIRTETIYLPSYFISFFIQKQLNNKTGIIIYEREEEKNVLLHIYRIVSHHLYVPYVYIVWNTCAFNRLLFYDC